ncbi:hypothetical protein SY2F82_29390 [Streptomyces sp. Y2F8-2]|nr:hypothetical protein SY2F82_29390 [Streptomyces sp. Y2F8-2]
MRLRSAVHTSHGLDGGARRLHCVHERGPETRTPWSVTSALAAVDVEDLSGDERGVLQVDDRVDDVAHLAHPAQR